MKNSSDLSNQFLIAMPSLQDQNFTRTVTYLFEYNEQGAMGIIINRPTDLQLNDILPQLEITPTGKNLGNEIIHIGGPVQQERGFVLHDGDQRWSSTLKLTQKISVTTSRDILESIAIGGGPDHYLIALGYAGWASGQLEKEISENSWLTTPVSQQILFSMPAEQKWQAAAQLIGIDLDLLSGDTGHA